MPHASSPTISTSPTPLTIYMHHKNVYVPLFYSISTTFVSYYPCITLEHALSRWRPRHFVKSIPRILRKREREISWRNKSPHTGGLYIYKRSTTFFPLFCPPSRYSFWNISQSPPSFRLGRRKLWFPLLFFFFFSFLFVAIVSQWLIVQGTATMCSVLQNCTRYVERKNLGRTNTVIHSSTF